MTLKEENRWTPRNSSMDTSIELANKIIGNVITSSKFTTPTKSQQDIDGGKVENTMNTFSNKSDEKLAQIEKRIDATDSRLDSLKEKLERIESTMATKDDLKIMRIEVKSDFSELKNEMHKHHIDIQRWIIATVISLFLGFSGLFFAMNNSLKVPAQVAQPAPQATAPIVIQVPAQVQAPAAAPPLKP